VTFFLVFKTFIDHNFIHVNPFTDLRDVSESQREIQQEQLDLQKSIVRQGFSDRRLECLHLFRLTSGSQDTTYDWYKDRVETRVEGTCEWFLNHGHFQHWLQQDYGPLLVSADPGCGKSVLAKYLIDKRLPRSATICYFFFKSEIRTPFAKHSVLCFINSLPRSHL
jgi:hypothetical protein